MSIEHFHYRVIEFFRRFAGRAKAFSLQCHVLFRLRVEGWVDDQTIHEDPQVIFDLKRFHVDAAFVFLLQLLLDLFSDHFSNVFNMTTTLRGGDRIDERHLLETFVRGSNCDLPPVADCFVNGFDLISVIVITPLEKEKLSINWSSLKWFVS